jgi:integrase
MPRQAKANERKRGNGRGSVRELPSGLWEWRVTLAGNPHRGTDKDKTTVERILAQTITDHARGILAAPDSVTVSEYVETWFARQAGLSERSIAMYRKELAYSLEHIGKQKVRDIRAPLLKSLMGKLAARLMGRRDDNGKPLEGAKIMSSRTLGKALTRLRSLFEEAVTDQIIYTNPTNGVRKPKTQVLEAVGTVLDRDQAARFHEMGEALNAAGVCALWPAIFTALVVGLRRSEVMGLRWKDVDLKNGVLHIRHTNVGQAVAGFSLGEVTKTHASKRDIEIPSSLRAMLEAQQLRQKREQDRAGSAWRDSGAVFATGQGWWVSPDNLNRAVNNVLGWSDKKMLLERYKPDGKQSRTAKKGENITNLERRMRSVHRNHRARLEAIVRAGEKLPDIRVHDLRHTYATLALRGKVPPAVVSKTLGHARISITLDIYRHVLPSEMKENVFDMFDAPLPVREVPTMAMN